MATTDYPKILMPAIELIEKQQAIINVLTARINEMSEMLGMPPISIDGVVPIAVPVAAPTINSGYTPASEAATNVAPGEQSLSAGLSGGGEPEVSETFLVPDIDNTGETPGFDPMQLNIFDGKYELKVGSTKGTFTLSSSPDAVFSFIYDTENCVDPVAEYGENRDDFSCNDDYTLTTTAPGEVELINDRWVVKTKAKVKFVKKK